MKKIAIFPGSFDPFTIGHESIVRRALSIFDKIIIAIGYNSNKPGFFSLEKRKEWINIVFENEEKIAVDEYMELTVEYCKRVGAQYILRGLRTSADFEYERAIAQVNKTMRPEIETVFLLTKPEHTPINSSIVRDIIRHGGNTQGLLPKQISISHSDIPVK
ncbi:MAG: pantetheine-phosphate adenylyltransferase [Bacteroidetes bacterium]|jgi:pantetheine-phosphate adenylyltransferase|nr:pantetheine-phosphate adenylyltransferase [Bacteroidota bacterium]MBT6687425.1 pantetheine-phosphate adenylyltransferase [Bacteroidota bacterium]MBT7144891.1 pantetheine-phosphate adenylyltransferase [Bacteroidota bacterium]MBT7493335.1 pantetheine-phosphate adenylyltransferase [Bacteroidota bacterium]